LWDTEHIKLTKEILPVIVVGDMYKQMVNKAPKKYVKIRLQIDILSAYAYYQTNTLNPISQAEFMYYRLKEMCQENREGWTKEEWRIVIIDMMTPLWACDLIEKLNLND
jgi:undecaprenyl pyrophosphate synthase